MGWVLPMAYFDKDNISVLFHLVSLRNIPLWQDNWAWLTSYKSMGSSVWRSGVFWAVYILVALLRRIKLLVLVRVVMARERPLSICCSPRYLFPILAVKHGGRGKEKRRSIALHLSCLPDSIWVLWLELADFILITSLGRRRRLDHPTSQRPKLVSFWRSPSS